MSTSSNLKMNEVSCNVDITGIHERMTSAYFVAIKYEFVKKYEKVIIP